MRADGSDGCQLTDNQWEDATPAWMPESQVQRRRQHVSVSNTQLPSAPVVFWSEVTQNPKTVPCGGSFNQKLSPRLVDRAGARHDAEPRFQENEDSW
jgi:hypothetical protein